MSGKVVQGVPRSIARLPEGGLEEVAPFVVGAPASANLFPAPARPRSDVGAINSALGGYGGTVPGVEVPAPPPPVSPAVPPAALSVPPAAEAPQGIPIALPAPRYGVVGTNTFQPNARQVQKAPVLPSQTVREETPLSWNEVNSDQLYPTLGAPIVGQLQIDPKTGRARVRPEELASRIDTKDAQELMQGALPDRDGYVQVDPKQYQALAGKLQYLRILNGEAVQGADGTYQLRGDGLVRTTEREVTAEQAMQGNLEAQIANIQAQKAAADRLDLQDAMGRQVTREALNAYGEQEQQRAEAQRAELARAGAEREQALREFAEAPPPGTKSFYERNTGAAIATMISAAFFGLAEKPELAMATVDRIVQRDLEAQREAYNAKGARAKAKDTAYAQARERFQDDNAAFAAAKAAALGNVQRDIEARMYAAQGDQRSLERAAIAYQAVGRLMNDQLNAAKSYQDQVTETQRFDPKRTVQTGGVDPQKYIATLIEKKLITKEQGQAMFAQYAAGGGLAIPPEVKGGEKLPDGARSQLEQQLLELQTAQRAAAENAALARKAQTQRLSYDELDRMQNNSNVGFAQSGLGKSDADRAGWDKGHPVVSYGPTGTWVPSAVAATWENEALNVQTRIEALKARLGGG